MKGLIFAIVKILLIVVSISSILYFVNVPLTQVAGEGIGFRDVVNLLLFQFPPNLPEVSVDNNTEISNWASKMDNSDLGNSSIIFTNLGNPIKFCVFRDYNYCQNFKFAGGKISKTLEPSQKTVYISYYLATEISVMTETQNFENLEKRLVQAVKAGEIKGLTLSDVTSIMNSQT